MPSFDVSSASPAEAQADLLMLPIFEGRRPGPGVEAVQKALKADLMATLKEHRVRGNVGDTFTIPTLGRIRAKTVQLVGLGSKDEAGPGAIRRASLKAARSAAKFGTVASTLAQVGTTGESRPGPSPKGWPWVRTGSTDTRNGRWTRPPRRSLGCGR